MSGQPDRVGRLGAEVPLDEVVVHGRTRSFAVPSLAGGRGPDPLLATEPPHPPLADLVAGALELIGEEAVAELAVLGVQVDQRVGDVGVVPVALRTRSDPPLVERLGLEAEHPAGQPHRDPFGGQVLDQREQHFGRVSLAK
jgi:hypothetical protein